MQPQITEINPIAPRANSKCVTIEDRKYLIGGMTAQDICSEIYQFKLRDNDSLKVQWKLLQFKKNLLNKRNSFAACGGNNNRIYIWGGLLSSEHEQACLSDLIQIDLDKREMRCLPLKQQIKIHSATLIYEETKQGSRLIGCGGTNQSSTLESYLYTLDLNKDQEKYQWKKVRLAGKQHNGYLWQHSSHLSSSSFFSGEEGSFLTTIGGCRYPQSPYPWIVEFDIITMKQTNCLKMKNGLVSHDSIVAINEETKQPQIFIFGGATGGDFNSSIIRLAKGNIQQQKGHPAVGCCATQFKQAYVIVGGVCGPEQINGVIIYSKNIKKQ